jgi:hypothetical protein
MPAGDMGELEEMPIGDMGKLEEMTAGDTGKLQGISVGEVLKAGKLEGVSNINMKGTWQLTISLDSLKSSGGS